MPNNEIMQIYIYLREQKRGMVYNLGIINAVTARPILGMCALDRYHLSQMLIIAPKVFKS